jgi:signal transduction histidine kinase
MILEECRGYREMAAEKKLDFKCDVPSHPITVRADRVKLSRVLGNLLGNALKFTEKGGIQIKANAVGNDGQPPQVEIRVCDSGPGIKPEFHERIFDEFFQLRSNGNRGAGLGLAICKRLVEAMGGSIRVDSTPGQGSTFTVRLPSSAVVRR